MVDDRDKDPENAIDPPVHQGGGGDDSAPESDEEASRAIDPPVHQGGGGDS